MSLIVKDPIIFNNFNMETPPPPQFKKEALKTNTKKPLERTVKTPFQSSSLFHRSFKSELQPNRISSRFHAENTNVKSNTRFYPSTSQRQLTRINVDSKTPKPTSQLLSRLGNIVKAGEPSWNPQLKRPQSQPPAIAPVDQMPLKQKLQSQYQPQVQSQFQNQLQFQFQAQTQTQAQPRSQPCIQAQPQVQSQSKSQPNSQLHSHSYLQSRSQSNFQSHSQSQPPQEVARKVERVIDEIKPSASHLIETRRTQQQTPHISRAHSEPSIKYQVQVNDKTYKILRKIGSGGSAKVYEGFESLTSQTVAIKIINVAQADPKTQESYFNEKSLLKRLRDSKYVVRMYDSEYKAECKELVIVMEKGDADLSQVIDTYFKNKKSLIDGIFVKFYWRGMVQAVNDIHQHGVVHADLKPVNFIIVKNEIKLIDFGIASAVDPGGTSIIRDYQIGTINYMAPESLKNRALDASFQQYSSKNEVDENNQQNKTVIKYNFKADIWSLGCILYNLVYGRPPFDKYKDLISKAQAITNPRHIIEFPEISNRNLLNCMKSCLRYNPADRPSAEDLLNDPYLREDIIMLQQSTVKSA